MGGFERVTWDLAARLAGRGHHVAFLTTRLPDGRDAGDSPLPIHTVEGTRPAVLDLAWWRGSAAWARA
ncbi:MAG TPA: glycosyl transferase family 1, partial [Candidatus Thermoplasmatota archaeon]|nr:glycosyl transferase family 1 [Candidatus Thermoplasmatota archaeon]